MWIRTRDVQITSASQYHYTTEAQPFKPDENEEWGMGNREWGIGNGKRRMGNGEWEMVNGKWGMGNGEWGMGNGEWEIEIGNWKWENEYFFKLTFHNME